MDGGFYPFMATGEEKTIYEFPRVRLPDRREGLLGPELHDPRPDSTAATIYITYDVDFLPATAPAAAHITPVHPIWMDVEAHHIYPVFDVYSGAAAKTASSRFRTWPRTRTGAARR